MPNLQYNTEGVNNQGSDYESEGCIREITEDNKKFLHDLLDEFLEAFERDPSIAKLSFGVCRAHLSSHLHDGTLSRRLELE